MLESEIRIADMNIFRSKYPRLDIEYSSLTGLYYVFTRSGTDNEPIADAMSISAIENILFELGW